MAAEKRENERNGEKNRENEHTGQSASVRYEERAGNRWDIGDGGFVYNSTIALRGDEGQPADFYRDYSQHNDYGSK